MRKNFFKLILLGLFLLTACSAPQPKLKPLKPGAVILAFGDSLTFGFGAPPEFNYPAILEKMIGHKVINAGVNGDTTSGGAARIEAVLQQTHPQLVIVCLGGNDFIQHKSPLSVKENLTTIIHVIQKAGIPVVLIAEPEFRISMKVNDLYNALGEQFNIPVNTNILPELLAQPKFKSDWIHFNAAGYTLFANQIAEFLKKNGAL